MKLISVIFSIYVLMLSLAPCTDTIFSEHNHDHNDMHLADERGAGDEDSPTDDCSPFCQCNCCHTPIIETPSINSVAIELQHPSQITFYISQKGDVAPLSIFQPPRV